MTTMPTSPPVDDDELDDDGRPGRSVRTGTKRSRTTGQKWFRWIHVYTSMIAFLLVLFFGITGITLNHPDWAFGDHATTTTRSGRMTFDVAPGGNVDFLRVSEYLRKKYGITADVGDYNATSGQASISYRSPGYSADVTFETATGAYRLTVEEQGFVAVMNDLHKGRDVKGSWKWVIDLSAGFLVLIAVTGLGLQLFLRRRRRSAVVIAAVGAVIAVVFAIVTL